MATVLTTDPEALSALRESVQALQLVAEYKLPPVLQRRMHELGEKKEFLGEEEHSELLGLVDFAQDRTLEKLKAMVALKRLQLAVPSLFEHS